MTTTAKRIQEMRAKAEERRAQRALEEAEAEKNGDLWTIQIAYCAQRAYAMIAKGRIDEQTQKAFQQVHHDASMFLEPQTFLGSKLAARQEVCKLANVKLLSITVVGDTEKQIDMNRFDLRV